jgi:hypothetical protein
VRFESDQTLREQATFLMPAWVLGPLTNKLPYFSTRDYGEGCGISATTAELAALSFPARSTAVTVYQ